ncbi:DNA-binding protein [Bacillus cereus]|nr:DNA-binding protein [Bacillus cereus]
MKEHEDMQTKEVIQQVGQLLRQIRNEQKLSLDLNRVFCPQSFNCNPF